MELSSVFIIIFSVVVVYILYKYWSRDKKLPADNQQSNRNRGPQVEVESITKSLLPRERGESNTEEYTEYAEADEVVDTTEYQSTFHRLSNNVKFKFVWNNKAGFESINKVTLEWFLKKKGTTTDVLLKKITYEPDSEGKLPKELKNFEKNEVTFSNMDFQKKEDKKDFRGVHKMVLKAYDRDDTTKVYTLYTSPSPDDASNPCEVCNVTEDQLNLTMELVEAKNFVFTAKASGFVKDTAIVENPLYILSPKTFASLNHMPFTKNGTPDYDTGLETELEPTDKTNVIYIKAKTTKGTSTKDVFKYLFWNGTKLSWESGTSKRTKFYVENFIDDISSSATTKRTIFSLASDTTKVLGYDKTDKKVTLIDYFSIQADMNKLESALWIIKYRKPEFKIIYGKFDEHRINDDGMLYLYMTKGSPSSQYTIADPNVNVCGDSVCISILSNKNTEVGGSTEFPGYQMYYMDVGNQNLVKEFVYKQNGAVESDDNSTHEGFFGDTGKSWQTTEPMFCDQEYSGNLIGADLGSGNGWGDQNEKKELWQIKPEGIDNFFWYCKNNNSNPASCQDGLNEGKEDFCRYGALRTGIIPFNKVWGLTEYGKGANKGSVPPIFKLISKKINDKLMVTFQVGWYNSDGIWQGFDNINPMKGQSDKTWKTTGNEKDNLWSQTDNTVLPGIQEFAEGGGIRVVTQWPAVASDETIVGEGYTGIKFYKGNNVVATGGLTSNDDFMEMNQF